MKARCLFRCASVKTYGGTLPQTREYEFWAQYDTSIPEHERFMAATPSGHLTITVTNPDVVFEPTKYYYLDIDLAEKPDA